MKFLGKQLSHPSSRKPPGSPPSPLQSPTPLPPASFPLLLPLPCDRIRMCYAMLSLQHDVDGQVRLFKKLSCSFAVQSTRPLSPFVACICAHLCECACNTFADYSCPPLPPKTHKTSNAGAPTSVAADSLSQIFTWMIHQIAQKGVFHSSG